MTRINEEKETTGTDSTGVNRRGFISKTLLAGAGVALAATQNQTAGQTSNSRGHAKRLPDGVLVFSRVEAPAKK